MSEPLILTIILGGTLILFLSDKVRPDAVALLALLACYLTGLLTLRESLDGFSSRAVLVIAAVLVIGRAMEVTGAGAAIASKMIPKSRFFTPKLAGLLAMGMLLSAFMNNLAALVITMPAAVSIARDHKLQPSTVLMPLAFATILGGMTTLIGTPANLILSSVREDELGEPFLLFSMTPVGGAVALVGLVYLVFIGWRLLPKRTVLSSDRNDSIPVFELGMPIGAALGRERMGDVRARVRAAGGVILTVLRGNDRAKLAPEDMFEVNDRILVAARDNPWEVAERVGLPCYAERSPDPNAVTTRVTVGHGSPLIGHGHALVEAQSEGSVHVVAVGPRPARLKMPLTSVRIQAGDQLYLHGPQRETDALLRSNRLIEIGRKTLPPVAGRSAGIVVAIYGLAVLASTLFGAPSSISFIIAALAICLLRLLPPEDIYRSIDWPVIVLLAAMIPVGRAFADTGAATIAAEWLSWGLTDASLFWVLAALCAASMIMSVFLNNVATALIMGQIGVDAARSLDVSIDAALLAVLIGSSCSFLTSIGHQNNLLVMRPGGYRFTDYPRMGAPLTIVVVLLTAWLLNARYG